jgi:hypothetical protein
LPRGGSDKQAATIGAPPDHHNWARVRKLFQDVYSSVVSLIRVLLRQRIEKFLPVAKIRAFKTIERIR